MAEPDTTTTSGRERPILFSGPMVRAILAGTKTQTRRLVKPQPYADGPWIVARGRLRVDGAACAEFKCNRESGVAKVLSDSPSPYGVPGDRLWVRETFGYYPGSLPGEEPLLYRADCPEAPGGWPSYRRGPIADYVAWRPSIHMPRAASRLTLEVTDVRVQRLQDISEEDAEDEGVQPSEMALSPRAAFERLWDSINAKRAPWDSNPWVWCVSFVRSGSPLQKEPVMR